MVNVLIITSALARGIIHHFHLVQSCSTQPSRIIYCAPSPKLSTIIAGFCSRCKLKHREYHLFAKKAHYFIDEIQMSILMLCSWQPQLVLKHKSGMPWVTHTKTFFRGASYKHLVGDMLFKYTGQKSFLEKSNSSLEDLYAHTRLPNLPILKFEICKINLHSPEFWRVPSVWYIRRHLLMS